MLRVVQLLEATVEEGETRAVLAGPRRSSERNQEGPWTFGARSVQNKLAEEDDLTAAMIR